MRMLPQITFEAKQFSRSQRTSAERVAFGSTLKAWRRGNTRSGETAAIAHTVEKQQKSQKQRQQPHEDQERRLGSSSSRSVAAAATVSSPRRLSESRCRTSEYGGCFEGVDFEFSTADDGEAEWDDSETLDTSRPFDRFAADATSPPAVTTRRAERHCARAAKQMIQQYCDNDGKTDEEYLNHAAAATDCSTRTLTQHWKPTTGPTSETLQRGKRKRKRRPPLSNEDGSVAAPPSPRG